MLHPKPQDLIALHFNGTYYYVVVLSKQIMFGGQLVFALHRTSTALEPSQIVLSSSMEGFHCIIDFLPAKKAGLLTRLARDVPTVRLDAFKFYRQDGPTYGLERTWAIWNRDLHVVKTPKKLTAAEWSYPILQAQSGHKKMCERIEKRWKPEHDRPE